MLSGGGYTSFHARVELGETAQPADPSGFGYRSTVLIRDSVFATPTKSWLLGQPGRIVFTFQVAGMISPSGPEENSAAIRFQFAKQTLTGPNTILNTYADYEQSFEMFDDAGNSLGAPTVDENIISREIGNPGDVSANLIGTLSGGFDFVFGDYLTYALFVNAIEYAPGDASEISVGSGLSEIRIFDQFGNLVEATLTSDSGTDYNPFVAPVPVPAALPLFASAIAVFGWLGWRRRRAG